MNRNLSLGKRFGLYVFLLFLFLIMTVILFQYHKGLQNDRASLLITEYEVTEFDQNEQLIRMTSGSIDFLLIITTMLTVFFIYKLYTALIIPLQKGIKLVKNLGATNDRWEYNYNNDFKFLVNSVNNFIDVSSDSFKLLEKQNKKLKLFTEIQDIIYSKIRSNRF